MKILRRESATPLPPKALASSRLAYLQGIARRGGPVASEYRSLDAWFSIPDHHAPAEFSPRRAALDADPLLRDAFSRSTCQGFVVQRPHGYAGDFEIIERIYNRWVSPEPHLARWDRYFQSRPATEAVRGRLSVVAPLIDDLGDGDTVLTIGAGPCKEIEDAVTRGQMAPGVEFTAIDIDQRAIEFAKSRVARLASVRFERVNAMRFRSEGTFSLVYSLGLFDYLSDRAFVALARRLAKHLRPGGRLVIGNFGEFNPTRGYMEFGGWELEHRSAARLKQLAAEAGLDGAHVTSDSTGVNLFLHFSAA